MENLGILETSYPEQSKTLKILFKLVPALQSQADFYRYCSWNFPGGSVHDIWLSITFPVTF